MQEDNKVELNLLKEDFVAASSIAETINARYPGSAQAQDSNRVIVKIPESHQVSPVDFVRRIRTMPVIAAKPIRVIMNEKTGTIAVTTRTAISSHAVRHGNIIVRISATLDVSEPSPFDATAR